MPGMISKHSKCITEQFNEEKKNLSTTLSNEIEFEINGIHFICIFIVVLHSSSIHFAL